MFETVVNLLKLIGTNKKQSSTLRPSATEFRKLRKNPAQTLIHCICNLADNFDNQDTTHDKAMLLFEEVCQVMISHYVSSEDLQEMLTEIIDNQEE